MICLQRWPPSIPSLMDMLFCSSRGGVYFPSLQILAVPSLALIQRTQQKSHCVRGLPTSASFCFHERKAATVVSCKEDQATIMNKRRDNMERKGPQDTQRGSRHLSNVFLDLSSQLTWSWPSENPSQQQAEQKSSPTQPCPYAWPENPWAVATLLWGVGFGVVCYTATDNWQAVGWRITSVVYGTRKPEFYFCPAIHKSRNLKQSSTQ